TYQDTGLLDRTHLRWFTRASIRDMLGRHGLLATRLERVVINPFTSGLPVEPGQHGADVLAWIEADPDARTFQYVVEARRRADVADPDAADALVTPPTPERPRLEGLGELPALRSRIDELERHNA